MRNHVYTVWPITGTNAASVCTGRKSYLKYNDHDDSGDDYAASNNDIGPW